MINEGDCKRSVKEAWSLGCEGRRIRDEDLEWQREVEGSVISLFDYNNNSE